MEGAKFIGKKYHPYVKYNKNDDENETETLDIKDYAQRNYEPKISIEASSKKNEMKNSFKKKEEESIDIREETFTPTKRNTILEEINKLKYKNEIFITELAAIQKRVGILEKKVRILQKDNEGLKKDIEGFKKDNEGLKKDNEGLKKDNVKLERNKEMQQKYIEKLENDLKMNKIDTQKNYRKLKDKIDLLEKKVIDLGEFHFSAKLRKLLKNLIGYIINRFYPHYMIYKEYKENIKRVYFVKAPRFPYNLEWAKDEEIIDALNRLLEFLFPIAKEKDCIINFFDIRAEKKSQYKRIFNVFKKPEDFFRYFNISHFDRRILIELIPEIYFTQIDNISFEINIKEIFRMKKNLYKWK